ncbi:LOW QUALITY PROTEIN: hypothetical protein ColTof4_03230 [Colletotrichum tofieldiae]|nr:LOW QUALITY PROTEIN: hypothetical protein ColTof3_13355 [Colletotrichum tofieldiae]GKT70807.1 LOW QUALITY PROTEIN: hypothetical protein ColTof4_03230 [Colletotrichum tofieldiae]
MENPTFSQTQLVETQRAAGRSDRFGTKSTGPARACNCRSAIFREATGTPPEDLLHFCARGAFAIES